MARLYTKKNIDSIEQFLRSSVNEFKDFEAGCCKMNLDGDLGLFVGWLPGYDPADNDVDYVDKDGYGLNAGIKIRNDFYYADYEGLNAPIYVDKNSEETGDIAMTDNTISRKEDFRALARYYLKEYITIRKAIDKGELRIVF